MNKTGEPKPEREDRRVRKTRRQLSEALTGLLREKKISEITVKELAQRADVNRGTFYSHYRDIYDMLERIENELLEELSAVMDAYGTAELRGGLRPIMGDVFRFIRKNAGICAALLESRTDDRFFQRLRELIYTKCLKEWQGLYPIGDMSGRNYALDFLVGGMVAIVQTWAVRGFAESPEEMAALTEKLILHGIGSGGR